MAGRDSFQDNNKFCVFFVDRSTFLEPWIPLMLHSFPVGRNRCPTIAPENGDVWWIQSTTHSYYNQRELRVLTKSILVSGRKRFVWQQWCCLRFVFLYLFFNSDLTKRAILFLRHNGRPKSTFCFFSYFPSGLLPYHSSSLTERRFHGLNFQTPRKQRWFKSPEWKRWILASWTAEERA